MPTSVLPFTIGQTVHVVARDLTFEPCPSCEGEGVLVGKDGLRVMCGGCRGSKETCSDGPWVVTEQIVTKMEVDADGIWVEYEPACTFSVPADQVFETAEEASADAARRNAGEES